MSIEDLQPRILRLLRQKMSGSVDCLLIRGEYGAGKSALLDHIAQERESRCVRIAVPWGTRREQAALVAAGLRQLRDVIASHDSSRQPIHQPINDESVEFSPAWLAREFDQLATSQTLRREPVWILVDDVDALHPELLHALRYLIARTAHLPGGVVCTATWEVPELDQYTQFVFDPLSTSAVAARVEAATGRRPPRAVARRLRHWSNARVGLLDELVDGADPDALAGMRRLVPGSPTPAACTHAERALARADPATAAVLATLASTIDIDTSTFSRLALDFGLDPERLWLEGWVRSDGTTAQVADGALARFLQYNGGSPGVREASQKVLAAAADILSADDALVLHARATSGEEPVATALGEAAIAAAHRGDSERASQLTTAIHPHITKGGVAGIGAAHAIVALLDGRLLDASDLSNAEALHRAADPERLQLACVHSLAQALSRDEIELGGVLHELRKSSGAWNSVTDGLVRSVVLAALTLGQVPAARMLAGTFSALVAPAASAAPAWAYISARLAEGATAADVQSVVHNMPLPEGSTDPLIVGEFAQHECPDAALRRIQSTLHSSQSTITRASLLGLRARVELRQGDRNAAEATLQTLEDVLPLEWFATAERLTIALQVRADEGRNLQPIESEVLQRQRLEASSLPMARLGLALGAWHLGRDEPARGASLIGKAVSSLTGPAAEVAICNDADLELTLPVLHLAMCIRQGRFDEAIAYVRETLEPRAARSDHSGMAARWGADLIAGLTGPAGLGALKEPPVPCWASGVVARTWENAAEAFHRESRFALVGETPLPGLTPREREVARRAARGMRNKEIAAEVYLSVRSVEATMTRLFRKTGTTSRVALAAVLHAHAQA